MHLLNVSITTSMKQGQYEVLGMSIFLYVHLSVVAGFSKKMELRLHTMNSLVIIFHDGAYWHGRLPCIIWEYRSSKSKAISNTFQVCSDRMRRLAADMTTH